MEEINKKSDDQLKNILDDLVDYSKHASKKDPLIKELSRPNKHQTNNTANSNQTVASLNSSTYSSAASSSSSSSSTASDSASDSSTSSSSSSSSSASSTASSPSQSTSAVAGISKHVSPAPASTSQQLPSQQQEFGKLEMAKMEELGKTAKILEHRLVPSVLSAAFVAVATSSSSTTSNFVDINSTITNSAKSTHHNQDTAQKFASVVASPLNGLSLATTSGLNPSSAAANTTASAAAAAAVTLAEDSWKTKRDKRRKKRVETSIDAKKIPGNRGNQQIDDLVKYIEGGSNSSSSNNRSNKNNNKVKTRHNSYVTSDNSNHQNIGSNNTSNTNNTNINSNNNSNNSGSSGNSNHSNNSNTNANTSVNSNSNSTINSGKKNESHPMSNKPQQMPSKMSNTNQTKNPPQTNQTQQQQVTPSPVLNSKQSTLGDYTGTENQIIKNSIKLNRQSPQQQQQNQQQQQPQQQLQQQQQSKQTSNHAPKQVQNYQPKRLQQPVVQQNQQPKSPQHITKQSCQSNQNQQQAVTFAHHIKVRDEDVHQYKFGFFDEQPNQTQHTKQIQDINNHSSTYANNSSQRAAAGQTETSQSESRHKPPRQSRASPNSEEKYQKTTDNIDAKSFNYEQILKFISNAWDSTQAQVAARNH